MTTLAVQSILFGNPTKDIIRAARSVALSCQRALEAGRITSWTYLLGDCSAKEVLDQKALIQIERIISAAGGAISYSFFNENLGSAAGHNRLSDHAESELILVLNPDALISPDCVDYLAAAISQSELIASAEARQIPLEHPKDYHQESFDTLWSSTACMMVRRSVFSELNGFDSDSFFLYCDDVDFSWRSRLAGYRVIYVPWATIFHDKRLTEKGEWIASDAEVYFSALAALMLAHKYSRPRLLKKISRDFSRSGSESIKRANTEFLARKNEKTLPSPIDKGHRVSFFKKGLYAPHRF